MSTIAEQVNLLREVKSMYGNNINCQDIIDKLIGKRFVCPQCHGKGKISQGYDAYPTNLPDSGWAHDWRYKDVTCPLCKGEGYTEHEYKPRMVQDGWI